MEMMSIDPWLIVFVHWTERMIEERKREQCVMSLIFSLVRKIAHGKGMILDLSEWKEELKIIYAGRMKNHAIFVVNFAAASPEVGESEKKRCEHGMVIQNVMDSRFDSAMAAEVNLVLI